KGRALETGEPAPRVELPMPNGGAAASDAETLGGAAIAVWTKPALESRPAIVVRELVPEVYDALVVGTRDYVVKNGFNRVVLGLSGGIDSSLCACVAVDAIGSENVVGAFMPSEYTSTASHDDARSLADALDIEWHEIPIREVFDCYRQALEPTFKGLPADTTE